MSDTSNQPVPGPSSGAFEELNRQIGIQAALVAGFAFAGLTVISYDSSTPRSVVSAFGLACAATIALELVALYGSGKLSYMDKRHQFGERLDRHKMAAAYVNMLGLMAFVTALNLLAWIKLGRAMSLFINFFSVSVLLGAFIWHTWLERLTRQLSDVEEK